jgi:cohesin complex subunit SA-1/2
LQAFLITSIAEVFTGGESSKDVASLWLQRFEADGPGGMTEMINFILKCAGCDIGITEDDINDPDNVETRLQDVENEFQAVSQVVCSSVICS